MKTKIIITLMLWPFSFLSWGQIIHVPGDRSSIQDAIVASVDGDTILVDTGTYYENINFLGKAITVASHYLIEQDSAHLYNTIIDGSHRGPNDSACVVLFNSGEDTTSVLYGFTITGGSGCYWPQHRIFVKMKGGGGIQIINCGAKICHNIITDNHVVNEWEAFGGGIQGAELPEDKMIIIEDNLVYNNSVSGKRWVKGGGIVVAFCHARICNNIVRNNTVTGDSITVECASGGIWYSNGLDYVANVNISGNVITNNEVISINPVASLNWGGGMVVMAVWDNVRARVNQNIIADNYIDAPNASTGHGILINQCDSVEFNNNVIYGNSSSAPLSYGGGVCSWNSHPLMSHNLIYGNSAYRGGGIYIGQGNTSQAHIINNTIYGNDATIGGGIYLRNSVSDIRNTIVWENTANSYPGICQEVSMENTVSYSDVQGGWTGTGEENIDSDPLFFDAASGDFHLTQNSPCINTGDPASPPDPDGSICDMGVFYYDSLYTEINDNNKDIFSIRCYPNPFLNRIYIEYDMVTSGNVVITVFNHLGQKIESINQMTSQTGRQRLTWSAADQPGGIYFIQIMTGSNITTQKIIKK